MKITKKQVRGNLDDRCRSANEWREQFVQFGGVYDAHCGGLDQLMNRFFLGIKKNPAKAGFR